MTSRSAVECSTTELHSPYMHGFNVEYFFLKSIELKSSNLVRHSSTFYSFAIHPRLNFSFAQGYQICIDSHDLNVNSNLLEYFELY